MKWHRLWRGAGLAAVLLSVACAAGMSRLVETTPEEERLIKSGSDEAPAIRSARLFRHFSDLIVGERFVKFVIDVKTKKIVYFNVKKYPMHTDYVFKRLYKKKLTPEGLANFMVNYNEEKPEYILGYLIHHLDQDLWTFSFWEGDRMSAHHVKTVYQKLKETFVAARQVAFRPDSDHHQSLVPKLGKLPILSNDAIYRRSSYQAFTTGKRFGVLQIVRDVDLRGLVWRPDDIVILKTAVPDISVVSGIISEAFSTPLSHVALRARAWGIPHIGLKNASQRYGELAGKVVLLEARKDGYTLRAAKKEEIAAWRAKKKKKRKVVLPVADLKERRLKPLTKLRVSEAGAYGAKTANLGEIVHSQPKHFKVPPGFGVPIAYYAEHMTRHGLKARAEKLMANKTFQSDPSVRKRALAELRKAILTASLDPKLLDEAWRQIGLIKAQRRGVFVRSSTNAEDLPGFNGAGLYDTVPNVRSKTQLALAIRKVWASVWNDRAYAERSFYGVDHRGVYAAILIQVGVNATSAGVMVTSDIRDSKKRHITTINAQRGLGLKVVEGRTIPEGLQVDTRTGSVKVVSRAKDKTKLVFDDSGGVKEVKAEGTGRVVSKAHALKLAAAGQAITKLFPLKDPLDIEWLFVKDTLYIVQSRPYVTAR